MPYPRLEDDGHAVTLDLHGATVSEALSLVERVLHEAAQRGRSTVKIIHGQSTSTLTGPHTTIKQALHEALDTRRFRTPVRDVWRAEAYLLLSLDVTRPTNRTRLRLVDVL